MMTYTQIMCVPGRQAGRAGRAARGHPGGSAAALRNCIIQHGRAGCGRRPVRGAPVGHRAHRRRHRPRSPPGGRRRLQQIQPRPGKSKLCCHVFNAVYWEGGIKDCKRGQGKPFTDLCGFSSKRTFCLMMECSGSMALAMPHQSRKRQETVCSPRSYLKKLATWMPDGPPARWVG